MRKISFILLFTILSCNDIPENGLPKVEYLTLLLQAHKYPEAIKLATEEIQNSNASIYYKYRGIAYFNIEKLDSAERDFYKYTDLTSSDHEDIEMMLGVIEEKRRNYSLSLEHYSKAIYLDSANVQYRMLRGLLCVTKLKAYSTAYEDFFFVAMRDSSYKQAKYYLNLLKGKEYGVFEKYSR